MKHWIAVCSRRENRDTMTIYSACASEPIKTPSTPLRATKLSVVSRWSVPRLSRKYPCGDVRKVRWCIASTEETSLADPFVALVDTALYDAVYVYRAVDGVLIRCISSDSSISGPNSGAVKDVIDENDGAELSTGSRGSEAELDFLGCSSVDFRKNLIAVADHSASVRVFGDSNMFLRPLFSLAHPQNIFAPTRPGADELLIFKEYATRMDGEEVSACIRRRVFPLLCSSICH